MRAASEIAAGRPVFRERRFFQVAAPIALAVVALAVWWSTHRAGRSDETAAAAMASEMAVLKRRLHELEVEQAQQRMVSSTLANAVEQQRQPAEGEPARSPAEAAAAPTPRPSAREQYEKLESEFTGEAVDSIWAAKTEAQIREVVTKFKGTNVLSSSCRSRMCRLEMTFADREAREEFEAQSSQTAPFTDTHVWMQRSHSEDGTSLRSVVMVSRGGPLPLI